MPKLPALTPKKLTAILKRKGFLLDHSTGSHFIFYNPRTGKRVTVPYHNNDLPKGTVRSILKASGLSRNDL